MDKRIIQKYDNRLKGYMKVPRQEYLFLREELNDREFILYRLIKDVLVDWDSRHPFYSCFVFDVEQITYYTGWHESKIRRAFNVLLKKALITLESPEKKLYYVVGFELQQEELKKKRKESSQHE